jgi:ribosomal protein S18 acetylase RimI-like enzyme
MAIREATESDLPALLPLLRGYCDFYEAKPSDEGLERMTRALIAASEREGFLLVTTEAATEAAPEAATEAPPDLESDAVVGFAACGWKWSSLRGARIVVLEDLFVAERARGRGHAEALIEATAGVARRHGAPVVTWLTAPDNRRAQAVYDRVGGHSEPFLEYELELDSAS